MAFLAACFVLLAAVEVASAASLEPPETIKVARRYPANDPNGKIYKVDTVDFRTYCVRVLSHEWAPAASFSPEALKAGALAVKSYGWYWATRPTKLADVSAWGADVDDTVNYQVYMTSDYGPKYWNAVDAVSNQVLTQNGAVLQASYRAGEYNTYASGWYMSQWGTQYWADKGKTYDWMCRYYYRNIEFAPVAGAAAASDVSMGDANPLALDADPSLKGDARLELVGPILAEPQRPTAGQRVTLTFTLHNAGAKAGAWDELTVVGRAPGDKVRDFGTVTDLKLGPGEYRMFEAKRVADLAGLWRGWMVLRRDEKVRLVADGAPFSFRVVPRGGTTDDASRAGAGQPADGKPLGGLNPQHTAPKKRAPTVELDIIPGAVLF